MGEYEPAHRAEQTEDQQVAEVIGYFQERFITRTHEPCIGVNYRDFDVLGAVEAYETAAGMYGGKVATRALAEFRPANPPHYAE